MEMLAPTTLASLDKMEMLANSYLSLVMITMLALMTLAIRLQVVSTPRMCVTITTTAQTTLAPLQLDVGTLLLPVRTMTLARLILVILQVDVCSLV
jgi:hypothetical protein